eukprot:448470-Prorocentrum_lima.AAC.1
MVEQQTAWTTKTPPHLRGVNNAASLHALPQPTLFSACQLTVWLLILARDCVQQVGEWWTGGSWRGLA